MALPPLTVLESAVAAPICVAPLEDLKTDGAFADGIGIAGRHRRLQRPHSRWHAEEHRLVGGGHQGRRGIDRQRLGVVGAVAELEGGIVVKGRIVYVPARVLAGKV